MGEKAMKTVDVIIWALLAIGGLNWGLIGVFNFDLVAAIFGEMSGLSRLIYILVGLAAVSPNGEHFGEVVSVQNYGAGDLLEIRTSKLSETLLLQFTKETVPEISVEKGQLVVMLPEGLLDDG